MLDPNYLLHISEGAEEIAEQLHTDLMRRIIKRIMLRIGRGDDYILTAQDKWAIENMQQAGYLLEDIQSDIAKATRLQQKEVAEAMEDAGVKALEYDDKVYQNAGLSTTPLTQSPELIRLMQRNYEATMGEWNNFTRTTVAEAQRLFINQLDRAYNLVSTGALSYTQAVKEILDSVMDDDLKITYPTGHTDTIETAILRAVRTGISQATGQIQVARMNEMDVDLVLVSSHLGARPTHQEWQGQVFSRSGMGKYPNFVASTGYGTVSGLCGANCRHSFSPFFEGMDNPYEQYDSKENREQYEKEQYQRTLERRIRNTKRETMELKEAIDNCKDEKLKFELDMNYQRKSALLAKQNAAYKDYCSENGLKPLSDRIQIARWDRQQAAAARGAAKRYENAGGTQVPQKKVIEKIIYGKQIKDYKTTAQSIERELDAICQNKSKWSGAIHVTKNISGLGQKEWDCSISLIPTANYSDLLHELIHARSISYCRPKDYLDYYHYEEGAVELLTEQICRMKGIHFVPTYIDEVKHLLRINRIGRMYMSDYEFAKALINVPLMQRPSWLIRKVDENYSSGLFTSVERARILDSISKLEEPY